MPRTLRPVLTPLRALVFAILAGAMPNATTSAHAGEPGKVAFATRPGRVEIRIGDQHVATYVHDGVKTLRPYFEHLRTTSGIQVTRNHPPVPGKDAVDHPDMHPGLWLAFGNLGGHDFWRNKGPKVEHVRFETEPSTGDGRGAFAVVNRYAAGDKVICQETARYTFVVRPIGYVILWDSTFTGEGNAAWLASQDEMGLGVRIATPITVKAGAGRITNSLGGENEKGTWGRAADWADYSGAVEGRRVGVTLMNDPSPERKPWFHSRDYGVLVANPTGPRAGAPDRIPMTADKALRLRFAVFVHESGAENPVDAAREYGEVQKLFKEANAR